MRRILTFALAGVMASAAPAMAETKLATGNDLAPFTDEDLPEGGLATDLIRSAYKSVGEDVTVEFMPWKRGERMVKNNKMTATFPYLKNETRTKNFAFSEPIVSVDVRPFVIAENAGTISSYKDMEGKRFCLPQGYSPSNEKMQSLIDDKKVMRVSPRNFKSCFRMLKRGRADFTNAERPTGLTTAKDVFGNIDGISVEDLVLSTIDFRLMFSKSASGVESKIEMANKALTKLRQSGEYDKIVEKHLK